MIMFGDRILLEKIEEKVEEKKSEGGIVIPNQVEERKLKNKHIFRGVIKLTGKDVKLVEAKDVVLFNIINTQQIELEGKEFFIMEEKNLLAKIAPEAKIQEVAKLINI
jgi:co-chaperonin GroES (HSP10)